MNAPDLSTAEQTHVRTALKFLRLRCGTWVAVSKALRLGKSTAGAIASGRQTTGDTTTLEDYGVLAKLREEEE